MTTSGVTFMASSRQFLRCHDSRDASRGVMFALPAPDSMIPRKPTLEELALSPVPDDLKCSACHIVYKEPGIALPCGHLSCKACLLKDAKQLHCPVCLQMVPANAYVSVNKQVDDVKVRCLNGVSYDLAEGKFTAGGWIGGCQEEMPYGEQESHLLLCVKMPVRCRYESLGCALVRGRGKIIEHEAVCPYGREKCRCGNVVEGHLMENHRAICPAVDVECPNSAFGCRFVIPRAGLAVHGNICPFAQVRPYFERQEEESRELKARLAFLEGENDELLNYKTSCSSLEEEKRQLRAHLANFSAQMEEKDRKLCDQKATLELREEELEGERSLSLERGEACKALEAKMKVLHAKMEELERAEIPNVAEAARETEMNMLRARVTELEEQNAALSKSLQEVSFRNANLVDEREKVKRLDSEARSLRHKVAQLQHQNAELEKERLGEADARRIGGPQTPHGELERTSAREPERWQEEPQHVTCLERGTDLTGGTNASSKSSPLVEGYLHEEVHEGEGVHDFCEEGGHADVESEGRVEDAKDRSAAAANTAHASPSDAELDCGESGGLNVVMAGLMQLASGNWRMNGDHTAATRAPVVEDESTGLRARIVELEKQMEVQASGGRHVLGDTEAIHTEQSKRWMESSEAEMQSLRRRVRELERQNFQQAQRVTELVDQNSRLATGNAKLSVVEREAKGLRERLEELEKQIKEMVTSEAAVEREHGDLPRIPDWVEERVNRLVGGLPALESSDKDEEAFRPRLAELARQNIELASQEVELKNQVHFLHQRCTMLEGTEDKVACLQKQVAELEKINHNLFQRNASLEGLWTDAREKAMLVEKGWRDHRMVRGTRASNRQQKAEVKVEVDAGPSNVAKEEETSGLNKLCAVLQTGSSQAEEEEETAGLNQLCAVLQLAEDDAGETVAGHVESADREVELVPPEGKQKASGCRVVSPRKRKAKEVEGIAANECEEELHVKVKQKNDTEKKSGQTNVSNGLPSVMTWGGVGESVKRRHAAPPVPPPAPETATNSSKSLTLKPPVSESKSGSSKQTSSDTKNGLSKAADFMQVLGPAYGGVGEAVKKRHARPPPGVIHGTGTGTATSGKVSPVKRPPLPPPATTKAGPALPETEEKRKKKRKAVNSLVDKDREKEKVKEIQREEDAEEVQEEKIVVSGKGKRTPKEGVKENERCIRSDGRDWRCHNPRMDAEHQFCESHYLQHKAKIERKHARRVSVEVKKPVSKTANKITATKGTGNVTKKRKVMSKSKKMNEDEKVGGPSRQCAYTGGHETWRCSKSAEYGMTHCKKHMDKGGKAIPWLAAAPAHKSGART
eukprot:TRINITY_DN9554_c0_g3_i1.p1 TRINITY_DN9554_c0_g3~~TRINITY_DN9554_c0_g3_i1.p1  ORF type:complete len:1319 (+),score=337.46 TRINITY_DN9554_c0_g3_i1:184-4140(+)